MFIFEFGKNGILSDLSSKCGNISDMFSPLNKLIFGLESSSSEKPILTFSDVKLISKGRFSS